ncbi:MAG: cobalamin biosynthesis protein [Oligoflexia bacterium]|nr:cobalamin biosynthesis protein [Oligoflexia bacterium]
MRKYEKLWFVILVLAVASPLGLYLPELMKAESAWGEWSPGEIKSQIGYIPEKMSQTAEIWKAPIPDYAFPNYAFSNYAFSNMEKSSLISRSLEYIFSALIGTIICGVFGHLGAKALLKRKV